MLVRVMPGLGDAIYHRPLVSALASRTRVWVETRWPDLFSDLPLARGAPEGPVVRPRYWARTLNFTSVYGAIARAFPEGADEPFRFDLPAFRKPDLGRYAVLRPPTLRADFYAPARNPRSGYIARAAGILRDLGCLVVAVGNLAEGREWLDGAPFDADLWLCRGELSIPELMGLIAGAFVVVAGPGWTVPASLAYRVPHVVVYGGTGRLNRPERLVDPRMDASRLSFVAPDRFCQCHLLAHACDKEISDFDSKFIAALGAARGVPLRQH